MANQPAVGLELRFTRAAHADAAAEIFEVGPHAREARQQIFELRELHLHLGLALRARTAKISRMNSARSMTRLPAEFSMFPLRGGELIVENQTVASFSSMSDLSSSSLPFPTYVDGWTVDDLRELADDHGARGVGELREFSEMSSSRRRAPAPFIGAPTNSARSTTVSSEII